MFLAKGYQQREPPPIGNRCQSAVDICQLATLPSSKTEPQQTTRRKTQA